MMQIATFGGAVVVHIVVIIAGQQHRVCGRIFVFGRRRQSCENIVYLSTSSISIFISA